MLPESPLQLPSGLQPSDVVVRLKVADQTRAELEGGPALDASVAPLPLGHILLAHQEDPVLESFQAGQGRFLSGAVYLAPSPQFQHPAPEPSPDLAGGLQPQHVPLGLEVDGEAGVEEEEVLALGAVKRRLIRSRRGIEGGPSFRLEFEQKNSVFIKAHTLDFVTLFSPRFLPPEIVRLPRGLPARRMRRPATAISMRPLPFSKVCKANKR